MKLNRRRSGSQVNACRTQRFAAGVGLVLATCAGSIAAGAAPIRYGDRAQSISVIAAATRRVAPDATPVLALDAARVAAAPTDVTPAPDERGLPWWSWPLLAVVVLAALSGLVRRRRPEQTKATRSSRSDPNINTRR